MLLRSFGSVTATGFPQRAQRKLRRTGVPSGPARSSPVSFRCAFFRHFSAQYRWVHRSARKRFPHTGQTASRFTARPPPQWHTKKTAQNKLSFLYGKSAHERARYDVLHGRKFFFCYAPPVRIADGLIAAALFVQRVLKLTVSPPFIVCSCSKIFPVTECFYLTGFSRPAQYPPPEFPRISCGNFCVIYTV